jgi:hypothetical protein
MRVARRYTYFAAITQQKGCPSDGQKEMRKQVIQTGTREEEKRAWGESYFSTLGEFLAVSRCRGVAI